MYWDLFIMLVLIFACLVTPCRIAFVDEETFGWKMLSQILDFMFLTDIIIIFNSVYYDQDFNIVTQRKTIAINYIKSWFFIDLIAIIPFEWILNSAKNYNEFVRIARIGRLYKLMKLTKLFKFLKVMREKNKMF